MSAPLTLFAQLKNAYPAKFSNEHLKQKYPAVFCEHKDCYEFEGLESCSSSQNNCGRILCPDHICAKTHVITCKICGVTACLDDDGKYPTKNGLWITLVTISGSSQILCNSCYWNRSRS